MGRRGEYEAVDIGRGLRRIVVSSAVTRRRFEDQAGVIVQGERVIVPEKLASGVLAALRTKRRKVKKAVQMEMLI